MLRLRRVPSRAPEIVLKLEGRVVGEWVDLVARECAAARRECDRVVFDMGDVTYADQRGLTMLRSLDPRAVRMIHCAPLLRDQLSENGASPERDLS